MSRIIFAPRNVINPMYFQGYHLSSTDLSSQVFSRAFSPEEGARILRRAELKWQLPNNSIR